MLTLDIIVASTRPGRVGLSIAEWVEKFAKEMGTFEVRLDDLAEIDLPMFNEPKHPRFRQYEHEHTKRWSERIEQADAFVVVTPEYNYAIPPALVNAFDYLSQEWKYKPLGFVSYGGVSAGTRAVQMEKQLISALGMMPIPEAVHLPFIVNYMKSGTFTPDETTQNAARLMIAELHKWAVALHPLHNKQKQAA